MTPPGNIKVLQEKIPQSKSIVIDPSGHSLMAEAPDATLDALVEFFS
jgi:pimeloyl-ACP methyl ester carboxylesterase